MFKLKNSFQINYFITKVVIIFITTIAIKCNDVFNNEVFYVNTTSGRVMGHKLNDLNITEYLNIPFAEPPIGELRFARPVPIRKPYQVNYNFYF